MAWWFSVVRLTHKVSFNILWSSKKIYYFVIYISTAGFKYILTHYGIKRSETFEEKWIIFKLFKLHPTRKKSAHSSELKLCQTIALKFPTIHSKCCLYCCCWWLLNCSELNFRVNIYSHMLNSQMWYTGIHFHPRNA